MCILREQVLIACHAPHGAANMVQALCLRSDAVPRIGISATTLGCTLLSLHCMFPANAVGLLARPMCRLADTQSGTWMHVCAYTALLHGCEWPAVVQAPGCATCVACCASRKQACW